MATNDCARGLDPDEDTPEIEITMGTSKNQPYQFVLYALSTKATPLLPWRTSDRVHYMQVDHRQLLVRHQGKVIAAAGIRFRLDGLLEYANSCLLDGFMRFLPSKPLSSES